jgi:hypothetical protein
MYTEFNTTDIVNTSGNENDYKMSEKKKTLLEGKG